MKIFQVALGILAAIGGFVDIGDIVFNVAAGATFGYELLWVVVIGVVGIIVYSEMCGRVAAVSGKAVFDAVRERVGFEAGLTTLIAAEIVILMTLAAEVGGVAICLQLLSGLPYRMLIVLAILGAVGALALQRYVIVVATAFCGAQTAIVGAAELIGRREFDTASHRVFHVYPLDPMPNTKWDLIAFGVLGTVGLIVQLTMKAKENRK